jgi:hypothetical protein
MSARAVVVAAKSTKNGLTRMLPAAGTALRASVPSVKEKAGFKPFIARRTRLILAMRHLINPFFGVPKIPAVLILQLQMLLWLKS